MPLFRAGNNIGKRSFLFITTYEKKTGFLLIETFRKTKLWPPGFDPWWPFLYVRVSKNLASGQSERPETM